MKSWQVALLAGLFAALIIATLMLTGCPRPVPAPVPPSDAGDLGVNCPTTQPTSQGVCDNQFTPDGLACANCPGASSCVDRAHGIYCVGPQGCLDPRCIYFIPATGGKP